MCPSVQLWWNKKKNLPTELIIDELKPQSLLAHTNAQVFDCDITPNFTVHSPFFLLFEISRKKTSGKVEIFFEGFFFFCVFDQRLWLICFLFFNWGAEKVFFETGNSETDRGSMFDARQVWIQRWLLFEIALFVFSMIIRILLFLPDVYDLWLIDIKNFCHEIAEEHVLYL